MANRKLTDLPELTSIADDDLIYGVDISDTSESAQGTSKKAKQSTLKTFFKTYFDTIYASISSLSAYAPINNPTFTGNVVVPNATENNEAVNLGQLNTVDENAVHKTGNETIAGVKTFEKSIKINSLEPLDAKYLNGTVAYASLEEANALIPIGIRSPYLTIVVQGAEYWWADGAWGIKKDTYISVTKAEINALIASNGLKKGALYEITGCQTALYGGTTLYLRALETNKLDPKGVGLFYTPKYENISGNGIWTGYVECGVSSIVGLFDVNELVTANNGATGQLFGNVNGGFITPISGTWASATSITGNASGATAVISSVTVPLTYVIGDKTIWGGYYWTNLTGILGSKVDDYNLDATNWVKVAFNETDYNFSYDEISYDIDNDWISYRKDKLGNEVSFTLADRTWFLGFAGDFYAIRDFKWGNYQAPEGGVWRNKIESAYINIINFRGYRIAMNDFNQGSYIKTSLFSKTSYISNSVFRQGVKIENTVFGFGSGSNSNTFEQRSYIINSTFGMNSYLFSINFGQRTYIDNTVFETSSFISNSKLEQRSYLANLLFKQSSYIDDTKFEQRSYISNSTFKQSSYIGNTAFEQRSYISNTIIGQNSYFLSVSFNKNSYLNNITIPDNKTLQNLTLDSNLDSISLTTAVEIFATYPRTIFRRPDFVSKIRYYNNNNVLVIADITD